MFTDRFAEGHGAGEPSGLSRRNFLKAGAAAGGGLILGVAFARGGMAQTAQEFAPDAFVRIDRDGRVAIIVCQVEMGQGTYTSMPMLIAEELEVPLSQVHVEHAPPDDRLYANPLIGFQVTGGSTSVRGFWKPLREAGAAARTMLISAAAQTWSVDPSTCRAEAGQVIHAPSGRKLAYGALADKAATLPAPSHAALKDPKDFKLIGTPAKRLDTPPKVNGAAKYGIDPRLPGLKVATGAACPVFGGKLAHVDDRKAKAVNGVRQIVQIDNAVAVVADHMGAAKKGLAALAITWDEGVNAKLSTQDIVDQLDAATQKPGIVAKQEGDVEKAIKGAAKIIEAVYREPLLAHTTMEPINCTVHVRKDGCDIWVGTQVIARAQAIAAEITGLPLDKIAVHNHVLGGGFGRRLEVDFIGQTVRIGQQVDGPVKIIWTREEDIHHDIYRPYYYDRLRAGLDDQGMPIAFHHRVGGPSILSRWAPPAFKNGLDGDAVEGADGPYGFPNLLIDYVRQEPPPGLLVGWWRGVGVTHNAFMVEGFVDELAAAAGKDPVEYRRALLGKAPRARAVLDLAAEKADWGKPLPPRSARGVALVFGFGSYIAHIAEVTIDKDGSVEVKRIVCAVDCGTVVNPDTVKAQIEGGTIYGITAALYGEITIKNGRVEQNNFDSYPALRMNEAPAIEVHLIDSNESPGGIGEPGTPGAAPAIVNAIFAATGKRLRKLPVDKDLLKSA